MSDFRHSRFDLLAPHDRSGERRRALLSRSLPPGLSSHEEGAKHYRPDADLVDAINVALSVGAPLLLTGEPGTGKTQIAHYLSWYFEIALYTLFVRSTTTAEDLLYSFDAVAYLHAANARIESDQPLAREDFIEPGPLWHAYADERTSVVLLDEIDKAPRDFPNDLLNVLDQHSFTVKETGQTISGKDRPRPIIIITSNSERRLPEPFLRRCIFHHIELTEGLVRQAVLARVGDFPSLSEAVREAAIQRFFELRGYRLRKRPATGELLVWLAILSAQSAQFEISADELRTCHLRQLPALSALIKDRDDYAAIE